MTTITIEKSGCKEGLLTVGRLVIVQKPNMWYPAATHQIQVDLLPVQSLGPNTGLTFIDPTIEVEISPAVSDGIERWFVPMSGKDQPNGHHPEYFDGAGWPSFLDSDPGIPARASRVRVRRDSPSIDWKGTDTAPNGLSFTFGVTMRNQGDSAAPINSVSFSVQAYANQVAAFSASCRRRVDDLGVGVPIPGFVPPA